MKTKIIKLLPLFFLVLLISCEKNEEAIENEYFRLTVDGIDMELKYKNAIDLNKDKSVYVSGGLYPSRYRVTVAADDLKGVGTITGAVNETKYSIILSIFTGPNHDLTTYSDRNDTSGSTITITRNDTYIEGSFSGTVKNDKSQKKYVSGSFKIKHD